MIDACMSCQNAGYLSDPRTTPKERMRFCGCEFGEARRLLVLAHLSEMLLLFLRSPTVPR